MLKHSLEVSELETDVVKDGFFADLGPSAACSVRVAVKVRPLFGREIAENQKVVIDVQGD
jgi:hypothetical protein